MKKPEIELIEELTKRFKLQEETIKDLDSLLKDCKRKIGELDVENEMLQAEIYCYQKEEK